VFNADRQLDDHREFVKRHRKRPGRTVSSDRVVPFHLVSIAGRGHAVRTVRHVTSHRLSSKSECVEPRRKIVSRQWHPLTARLQSLPLARCWCACYAVF